MTSKRLVTVLTLGILAAATAVALAQMPAASFAGAPQAPAASVGEPATLPLFDPDWLRARSFGEICLTSQHCFTASQCRNFCPGSCGAEYSTPVCVQVNEPPASKQCGCASELDPM